MTAMLQPLALKHKMNFIPRLTDMADSANEPGHRD